MSAARLVPAVALLVVLAGCAGLPGGGPATTATTTDAPDGTTESPGGTTGTTTTPTTSTVSATPDFPAGLGADGVTDAEQALGTHRETLLGSSFGYEFTRSVNRTGAGVLPLNQTFRVGYEGDTEINYMEKYGTAPNAPAVVYAEGALLFRQYRSNEPAYRYGFERAADGDADPALGFSGPSETLVGLLAAGDWEYVGQREVDGTTVLDFEASGSSDDAYRDFTGGVAVTTEGTIRELSASYVRAVPGAKPIQVSVNYAVEPGIEAPAEPAWVASIPQLAVEAGDTPGVVELRNEGGATLEAGTTASAFLVGNSTRVIDRNLTLPTELGPDSTLYVYPVSTGNGTSLEVATDAPAVDEVASVSEPRFVLEGVDDVRVNLELEADAWR